MWKGRENNTTKGRKLYIPQQWLLLSQKQKKGRDLMILARALGTCIKLIEQISNSVLEGTQWIADTCSFFFQLFS